MPGKALGNPWNRRKSLARPEILVIVASLCANPSLCVPLHERESVCAVAAWWGRNKSKPVDGQEEAGVPRAPHEGGHNHRCRTRFQHSARDRHRDRHRGGAVRRPEQGPGRGWGICPRGTVVGFWDLRFVVSSEAGLLRCARHRECSDRLQK